MHPVSASQTPTWCTPPSPPPPSHPPPRNVTRRQRASGLGFSTHEGASTAEKSRRAVVVAAWLVETFGRETLSAGTGVLDVAGRSRRVAWVARGPGRQWCVCETDVAGRFGVARVTPRSSGPGGMR